MRADGYEAFLRVFVEVIFPLAAFGMRDAVDEGAVGFGDFAMADLFGQDAQGDGVFGGQDEAFGASVEAVGEGGDKAVGVGDGVAGLLEGVAEGVFQAGFVLGVWLAEEAGGFVEDYDVFVLVENGYALAGE